MRQLYADLLNDEQCDLLIASAIPLLHGHFRPTYATGRTGCQLTSKLLEDTLRGLLTVPLDSVEVEVVRYELGAEYGWHRDSIIGHRRDWTLVINLSDGFGGGELEFKDEAYRLRRGEGLLFDDIASNQHRIRRITAGIKWSAVLWGCVLQQGSDGQQQ